MGCFIYFTGEVEGDGETGMAGGEPDGDGVYITTDLDGGRDAVWEGEGQWKDWGSGNGDCRAAGQAGDCETGTFVNQILERMDLLILG